MKLALALLAAVGCSFSARLDDQSNAPEAGPGDAKPPDGPPLDAPPIDAPDQGLCALSDCVANGGICQLDNTCLIDIGNGSVTCPAGVPCRVICDSSDSCQTSVDCSMATSCHVTCRANNACKGGVECGNASPCEVVCDGRDNNHSNVCEGMITSMPPATCSVHCCGTTSNLCAGGASNHCTEDMVCP